MSRRSTNPAIVFAMLIWIAAGSSIIVADEGRDANRENDHVYFERDVLPAITAAGCNTGHCHGSSVPRENGGFRLSLFESDPQQDYAALVDGPTGPLVDTKSPGKSQLLRKAKGELKHASGQKWPQDSRSIKTIQRWISLGANPPAKGDPRITRILVEPSTVDVRKGDTFRLRVRAVDSSGVQRDVTQMVQFRIVGAEDGEPVARAADAAFKVQSPGNAVIVVKYARRTAMVAVRAPFSDPVEVLNFEPNNFVDGLLARRWRQMGVNPVANADDWQFARRTWVHLTGRNPHADEVQMFVASSLPDKRGQWIERALAHPDYAKHWAETWQDWLDTEESNLSNDERAEFDDWLRSVFRESLSAREMAASLLTAVGTINTDPASGYMLSSKILQRRPKRCLASSSVSRAAAFAATIIPWETGGPRTITAWWPRLPALHDAQSEACGRSSRGHPCIATPAPDAPLLPRFSVNNWPCNRARILAAFSSGGC